MSIYSLKKNRNVTFVTNLVPVEETLHEEHFSQPAPAQLQAREILKAFPISKSFQRNTDKCVTLKLHDTVFSKVSGSGFKFRHVAF